MALLSTRLKFQDDPTDPRHGTENGYHNLECRCARCTKAHADYFREGRGNAYQRKSRIESGLLKKRYRIARDAGHSSLEARRRMFWSNPLKEE